MSDEPERIEIVLKGEQAAAGDAVYAWMRPLVERLYDALELDDQASHEALCQVLADAWNQGARSARGQLAASLMDAFAIDIYFEDENDAQ